VVAEMALSPPMDSRDKPRRRHTRTRPQLLSRQELDRRLNSVSAFDRLASQITADLGVVMARIPSGIIRIADDTRAAGDLPAMHRPH
jgi:hypothetical protein